MNLEDFVSSAVILLITASLMNILFKRLGLGSIAGLLVAGIIVGPYTPGPYITTHVESVRNFAELGVVLLLFVIGLEMRPSRIWALRREIFGLGILEIIFTAFAISGYMFLNHPNLETSIIIGLTFAMSSTAIVMQMLLDRGEIASPHGKTVFGVLLMQDIAIVPILALIPLLSFPERFSISIPEGKHVVHITGAFLVVLGFGKFLIPFALDKLARQKNREGFLIVTMLSVFLSAWAMHKAGFSLALGAFLMGMLLSDCRYNLQIEAYIEPYKRILISLFFVAVGMSIDIGLIASNTLLFIKHLFVITLIKITIIFLLCLILKMSKSRAINVSFMLAQGGEFGFVLLASAKSFHIIDDDVFIIGISIISVSMLFTPLLARFGNFLSIRFSRKEESGDAFPGLNIEEGEGERVIIGGYGRVGHIVAVLLHANRVPFIVFDNDPVKVAKGKSEGFPVYYGDIANPELLAAVHLENASLVVLTVDQESTAVQAISHIRNNYTSLPIIARARDLEGSERLIQKGATIAMPEALESSLRLANETLKMVGVPSDDIDLLLMDIRRKNYELVAGDKREGHKG
ncbi:MAG: cation:proton antiporter [Syntrophorhabdaceae bacterium]|nr:cation:proton antiporter [Syntrophorhabdaceae bacterium]